MNPILIRNIGLTSKGLLKNQDKEGVSLSPQLEQTNTNLLDKNRLFEVVNVIKLKWLATFSAINWLKEDKKTTLNIITSINDGLKLTE